MTANDSKQRIAVLGGGLSSLTTVFELTSIPRWRELFDITVYQMGFRLGGKGASGRNREMADRIEEHGLHVFFGFYENAIGIMRRCYQELGRYPGAPLATWQEAFKQRDLIVMEEFFKGRWHHWPLPFPRNDQRPGDWCEPFPDGGHSTSEHMNPLPSAWSYLQMALELACDAFDHYWWRKNAERLSERRDAIEQLLQNSATLGIQSALEVGQSLFEAAREVLGTPLRDLEAVALHAALAWAKRMPADAREHGTTKQSQLAWLLARFRRWIARELRPLINADFETYKIFVLMDLAVTTSIGMIEDDLIVPPVDWHKIDDEDFRGWLKRHGGSDELVASAPVRTLYSAAFATGTTGAAGTTLHNCLRMILTYKGSVLWEMQASMGDTIFTPLYTVLKRRGVKFEFFCRVDELKLGEPDEKGRRRLETIAIGRQDALAPGVEEYDPLFMVKGLPCWPSEPRYEQLAHGEELEKLAREYPHEYALENWWTKWKDKGEPLTLRAGQDFDLCVLGIGIGAFPYICKDMIHDDQNPHFGIMVDGVKTTLTQAAQLWMRPNLDATGWPMERPVVIPYAEPYDTWADMSQLIARERWEEIGHPVGSIAYLCSRLADEVGFTPPPRDDHKYPFGQLERARRDLRQWLQTQVRHLWPHAVTTNDEHSLNLGWLVDPKQREGMGRLEAQFCVADWNPSDRYVLSVAGGTRARLRPDESGYDNVILTGDWTLNAFNAGCAEAATVAGMLASRAICGYPQRIVGEWLDEHPDRRPVTPERKAPPVAPAAYPFKPDPVDEVPYIPRPGDLLSPPPVIASGATMCCFVLSVDPNAIQKLCDKYLNLGPTVYKPALPVVSFAAVHIDKAHPAGQQNKGFMPERDYAFWVPLLAGRNVADRFEPERFVWYQPYMWVDNDLAVVDGREVYGLEKSYAHLQGPGSATDPARFGVDTVVSVLERGVEAKMEPIVRVGALDRDEFGEHPMPWQSGKQVGAAVKELLRQASRAGAWEGDLELLFELMSGEQIIAALKQTPTVTGSCTASYQAIVETPSHPTSDVSGGVVEGDYRVDVKYWPSHEVVSVLGLQTESLQDGWQRAQSLLNLRFKFDFEMGPGREVYRLA